MKLVKYTAADAKKQNVAHIGGHGRLGRNFTACGRPLGAAISPEILGGFRECQACLSQLPKEKAKQEARVIESKTLRDEFAMSAAVPLATAAVTTAKGLMWDVANENDRKAVFFAWAKLCYEAADAMVEARK
ncbi:MAG: hypothetical protein QME60_08415 [Verrucomicrobiota bacterium]|nr:hypothetical protein [Verrucomicrobiota bacterium]